MKIDQVLREILVALFSDSVMQNTLVLKGGAALRFAENLTARLSTDIDLSTPNKIETPEEFFTRVESVLKKHFNRLSYDVIDVGRQKKPRHKRREFPPTWGGWAFQFKLSPHSDRSKDLQNRRRSALIPEGGIGSTLEIEISEYEYCDSFRWVDVGASRIRVYSNILLVLEKIRAICQQHPSYKYLSTKSRAQDYYDIFQLVQKYRNEIEFIPSLRELAHHVFEAKEVPLDLMHRIFEPEFVQLQRAGFSRVTDNATERIESFEYYLEQLKILIMEIAET